MFKRLKNRIRREIEEEIENAEDIACRGCILSILRQDDIGHREIYASFTQEDYTGTLVIGEREYTVFLSDVRELATANGQNVPIRTTQFTLTSLWRRNEA